MFSRTLDSNGQPLYSRPRKLSSGVWAALTWANGTFTPDHVCVRIYETRRDARYGEVSEIGRNGWLGFATPEETAEYYSLIGEAH